MNGKYETGSLRANISTHPSRMPIGPMFMRRWITGTYVAARHRITMAVMEVINVAPSSLGGNVLFRFGVLDD